MKRLAKIGFLIFVILILACCSRKGRVIPQSDMIDIFGDMILLDEWVQLTPKYITAADTSLAYVPIFEKYGYTKEDYLVSIDFYLNRPGKFAKMFGKLNKRFLAEVEIMDKEVKRQMAADSIMHHYASLEFKRFDDMAYINYFEKPYSQDTINIQFDEDGIAFLADATPDTLFDGPRLIIKQVADTLQTGEAELEGEVADSEDGTDADKVSEAAFGHEAEPAADVEAEEKTTEPEGKIERKMPRKERETEPAGDSGKEEENKVEYVERRVGVRSDI